MSEAEAQKEKIAVIGLGYVGLPVALALAKKFPGTIGFDVDPKRTSTLSQGIDVNNDVSKEELKGAPLKITSNAADLKGQTFFIVAVPTPVDDNHRPDFHPLESASNIVGNALSPGGVVVYESTVYPGVTEEVCGPILSQVSGLKQGSEFKLGYSPERINPGDREHSLEKVIKVVSAEDEETLKRVCAVYERIITAGLHRAPSIKVAEAAKVIENTQRDLNIALMNELAIIFDRIGISTTDVLEAAGTKWNFLQFRPGLVGGHCIGVDPYYLTTKAEQLGYHPQVILAGRRINDGMGSFIAQRIVKLMVNAGVSIRGARVGILGMTFKENVSDIRNTRVPSIVSELKDFGIIPSVHDPIANNEESVHEYGISLSKWEELRNLDGLIFAVAHKEYLSMSVEKLTESLRSGGVFVDVKSAIAKGRLRKDFVYWSL